MVPLVAALGATALSAGGSFLSGIVGSGKSDKINRRNLAFAREQSQLQRDFITDLNDANNAYNDPSAQRDRLIAAGYNPYLNQAQSNMASSVGIPSLASANQIDSGSTLANGISGAANSIANFFGAYNSLQQSRSMAVQTDTAAYNLDRQRTIDNVKGNDGSTSLVSQGRKTIADANFAMSQANISAAQEIVSRLTSDFFASQAYDESGEPVVDQDGNAVSNLSYREQGNTRSLYKSIDKLSADVANSAKQGKILDIDATLKQFEREHLQPAQLDNLRAGLAEINSKIMFNVASADAAKASAALSYSNASTTNAIRPYVVGKASWDNQGSKYGALSSKSEYLGSGSYGDWFDKQPSWIKWSVNAARGLSPIFGGAANAGSAYRSFKR